jgi:hypothetical protein
MTEAEAIEEVKKWFENPGDFLPGRPIEPAIVFDPKGWSIVDAKYGEIWELTQEDIDPTKSGPPLRFETLSELGEYLRDKKDAAID